MFTTIGAWFSSTWLTILPWFLAVAGIAGTLIGVRQSGKNAAYQEIATKQIAQTQGALNVQETITNMSDSDVANKLHDFLRD